MEETPPPTLAAFEHTSPYYRAAYPFLRLLLCYTMRALAPRLRISGRHNVPIEGPVLIAPNHLSDADPPLIANAAPRPLWYMGKRELFAMRGIGPIIKFWRTFPVERGEPDRAALRLTEKLLKRGQAVVIFPEGQISPTGEFQSVLPGAVMLALRVGVPIVPAAIINSPAILPYGELLPRPTLAPVRVHFAPPLHFDDLADLPKREQREIAAQRLDEAMRAAMAVVQQFE